MALLVGELDEAISCLGRPVQRLIRMRYSLDEPGARNKSKEEVGAAIGIDGQDSTAYFRINAHLQRAISQLAIIFSRRVASAADQLETLAYSLQK